MKKINLAILILVFSLSLSSCFKDSEEVSDAKKELWIIKEVENEKLTSEDVIIDTKGSELEDTKTEDIKIEETKKSNFHIENITMNNFIELDDLSWKNLNSWEVEITWKTLLNVEKIEVKFSNENSEFPIDNYTLKQFNSWDKVFKYRAFSRYQTLDFWKNEYIFTAYSWGDTSKLRLIINVEKEEITEETKETKVTSNITYEKKLFWEDGESLYMSFPKSEVFWEMISLWETSFTYSNIDNFEVVWKDVSNINCSNITEPLKESLNSWFYWNTCRDIIKEKWIKFNVIRLDGEKYIYERHYIDYSHSLYWIYVIEEWTGVTSDNIKEKNSELKAKEFENVKIVDELFYEIVR